MKSLVTWSTTLDTGLPAVDRQHRTLVQMLNDYAQAVARLEGQERLSTLLRQMNEYTVFHFTDEEDAMRRRGYPDLPRHQVEHRGYIAYLESLHRRVRQGEFVSSLEVLTYLRDWLTHHIQSHDQDFGRWASGTSE